MSVVIPKKPTKKPSQNYNLKALQSIPNAPQEDTVKTVKLETPTQTSITNKAGSLINKASVYATNPLVGVLGDVINNTKKANNPDSNTKKSPFGVLVAGFGIVASVFTGGATIIASECSGIGPTNFGVEAEIQCPEANLECLGSILQNNISSCGCGSEENSVCNNSQNII